MYLNTRKKILNKLHSGMNDDDLGMKYDLNVFPNRHWFLVTSREGVPQNHSLCVNISDLNL